MLAERSIKHQQTRMDTLLQAEKWTDECVERWFHSQNAEN